MSDKRKCRFQVNTRVLANLGSEGCLPGTIVKTNHIERSYDTEPVPYQINLDDGRVVFAPNDHNSCVRLMPEFSNHPNPPCVAASEAYLEKYDSVHGWALTRNTRPNVTAMEVALLILQYKEDILNVYLEYLQDFADKPEAPYYAFATREQIGKSLVQMSRFEHQFEDDDYLFGTIESCMAEIFDMNQDMLNLHMFLSTQDDDAGYKTDKLCEFYTNRVCSYGDQGLYAALAVLRKNVQETEDSASVASQSVQQSEAFTDLDDDTKEEVFKRYEEMRAQCEKELNCVKGTIASFKWRQNLSAKKMRRALHPDDVETYNEQIQDLQRQIDETITRLDGVQERFNGFAPWKVDLLRKAPPP